MSGMFCFATSVGISTRLPLKVKKRLDDDLSRRVRGLFFADVNNDGRADAIAVDENKVRVRKSDGASFDIGGPLKRYSTVSVHRLCPGPGGVSLNTVPGGPKSRLPLLCRRARRCCRRSGRRTDEHHRSRPGSDAARSRSTASSQRLAASA